MKSKPDLVLITNHFPFGIAESFLENEIQYIMQYFNKVLIITKDNESEGVRDITLGFKCERIPLQSSLIDKLLSILLLLRWGNRTSGYIIEEFRYLRSRHKKASWSIIRKMFHDLLKALVISAYIKRYIRHHHLKNDMVLYSYWLTSSALATTFVHLKNQTVKRIARAHRVDLYEEEHPDQYLTFRSVLAKELNKIYSVSVHGLAYLNSRFINKQALALSRLGTTKPLAIPSRQDITICLVSCSSITPIKQVHRIANVLSLIKDTTPIHWIHFGDGPLRQTVENAAKQKLNASKTITFEFHGAIKNQALIHFYENNFVDLFISTSSSEGIPVSMMEAQSFGIPILALDVGGVGEVANIKTGKILPGKASDMEIADGLTLLINMPIVGRDVLRAQALEHWNKNFDAGINYKHFLSTIINTFNYV